jgi:signal transduction histidine kinase
VTLLLRGKPGGLIAFVAIAVLVAGGLGWATAAALRLEREQLEARAEVELAGKLRLALWRLDSLVGPILARENSRPYNHYSALFAPALALRNDGCSWPQGTVLETSPLLEADLPEWMLLHFQVTTDPGWASPQVLSPVLLQHLQAVQPPLSLVNVTPERVRLLEELSRRADCSALLAAVQRRSTAPPLTDTTVLVGRAQDSKDNLNLGARGGQPQAGGRSQDSKETANPSQPVQEQLNFDYQNRAGRNSAMMWQQRALPLNERDALAAGCNLLRNGEDWLKRPAPPRSARTEPVAVRLGTMVTFWLPAPGGDDWLVSARLVEVGAQPACQGILLDWPRLREVLRDEVGDLFPEAAFEPVREDVLAYPERTLTALPVTFEPGVAWDAVPGPGWTTLRVGLALAWAAAGVALLAVGLGGWSLLDLSERRIRFVSAVTHELRTPLTTLRLYLDMLTGGLVRSEEQKTEYLHTLNAETERLNRLVGNVLDFSRLENQRPQLARGRVVVAEFLEQVRATWAGRCHDMGKTLIVEDQAGPGAAVVTDAQLVQQVVGNLIDNACKYSRGAPDPRVWLRANRAGGRLVLEVEDCGPGVPARERRTIFRPFRRGRGAEVTAGGVGLGLALAHRWAGLLGGRLTLCRREAPGACFRFELPLAAGL